jgi:hypothetical protein
LQQFLFMLMAVACLAWLALPVMAKPFHVEAFNYYLSDYDHELGKLSKTVAKTDAQIRADIAMAEAAANARLAAASIEQLLTRHPNDGGLWLKLAQNLIVAVPVNDQDEASLPAKIIGAALRAYLLAIASKDEAAALAIAAQGFAKQQLWRQSLQAYRKV